MIMASDKEKQTNQTGRIRTASSVRYMPYVTGAMSRAAYWSDKVEDPKKLLAGREEIAHLNRSILEKSADMTDMAAWSETGYDLKKMAGKLVSRAVYDAEWLKKAGAIYDPDGTEADYDALIELCVDPNALISVPDGEEPAAVSAGTGEYKFAVCTTRTSLTIYPSKQPLLDDPADIDFDYNYLTQVKVNEPLILRTRSRTLPDGSWYYSAISTCGEGWVPADCVAICKDKDEWLGAWHHPADQMLVILDGMMRTEGSNTQPETSNRWLSMGTRLQLADEEEVKGLIGGRSAYNNYVVWMPVRKPDGTYEKKLSLISGNRKVSAGVPDLTAENLLDVAFNALGDVYGWGSMLGADDCSGYIRDVYSCFGLDMPRSANRNNGAMKNFVLRDMSDEEKISFIKTLPPGTSLMISGHEMMYLGHEGDRMYVISPVCDLRLPGDSENTRVLGTVINTLDICREDDQTWLHHLYEAMIPFCSADQL